MNIMTQPTILGVKPCRALTVAILALLAVTASARLHAQTYTVLYNFSAAAGPINPQNTGQITQGRDGNLWSATPVGGSFGGGAAFDITPSGALAVIENFNNPGGVSPYGGLILSTDGNFYGTTEAGGLGYQPGV
jgi:hypothetical protein